MLTVAQLIDQFRGHCEVLVSAEQMSRKTANWYRPAHDKLARKAGHQNAAEVKTHHLVGIRFTNHFVRALKALFKWAVDEEVLVKHPFSKLRTPPCGQRNRILDRAEQARLYRVCTPLFRRFMFLQSRTIARPGEIRLLQWQHVRLDDRLLVLDKFKGKKRRQDGKKVRTIPLDAVACRLLRNMRSNRAPAPDDYVFVSERTGKPLSANSHRCRMRTARVRAGLEQPGGERVVNYTLRHTGATAATQHGIRDRLLADIMGHTKTSMTERYQHLSSSDLVDGIDRLRAAQRKKATVFRVKRKPSPDRRPRTATVDRTE